MALAASDFTLVKRRGVAPGTWVVTGKYTGPSSYTSGGESLTNAILKAATGLNTITTASFSPMFNTSGNTGVSVVFDHVAVVGTSQGKIRFVNQGSTAHLHSFKVIGGQAAAGTDTITVKGSSPVVIGKEEATDKTALGGATNGGVLNSTSVAAGDEVTAGTSLSSFSCRFVIYGS